MKNKFVFVFSILLILCCLWRCENASEKVKIRQLDLHLSSQSVHPAEELHLTIEGEITKYDSINFTEPPVKISEQEYHFTFKSVGRKSIGLKAFKDGEEFSGRVNFMVYPKEEAGQLLFEILNIFDHDPSSYTQGLEISEDTIYESKGQYGTSAIRKYPYSDLKKVKEWELPANHFGEGLSILGDTVYQLTWRENICYLYDKNLHHIGTLPLPSGEGWGLCNNGKQLFYSDGSHRILVLDRKLQLKDRLEIYNAKYPLNQLNELDFAKGKIYANVYQSQRIFIINPESGTAEAFIDFSSLRQHLRNPRAEVLNGIAYNKKKDTFLITGKYWDKMFEVRIKELEVES